MLVTRTSYTLPTGRAVVTTADAVAVAFVTVVAGLEPLAATSCSWKGR
jgi:hypothetical protein